MDDIEREYDYRIKWSKIIILNMFFTFVLFLVIYMNIEYAKGAKIDGGTVTLGLVAVFVAVLELLLLVVAYDRWGSRQRVAFTAAALVVPASRFSRSEKAIAYRDIRTLSVRAFNEVWFLDIFHTGGKYTIKGALLPSQAVFEEVRAVLAAKVQVARTAPGF